MRANWLSIGENSLHQDQTKPDPITEMCNKLTQIKKRYHN